MATAFHILIPIVHCIRTPHRQPHRQNLATSLTAHRDATFISISSASSPLTTRSKTSTHPPQLKTLLSRPHCLLKSLVSKSPHPTPASSPPFSIIPPYGPPPTWHPIRLAIRIPPPFQNHCNKPLRSQSQQIPHFDLCEASGPYCTDILVSARGSIAACSARGWNRWRGDRRCGGGGG